MQTSKLSKLSALATALAFNTGCLTTSEVPYVSTDVEVIKPETKDTPTEQPVGATTHELTELFKRNVEITTSGSTPQLNDTAPVSELRNLTQAELERALFEYTIVLSREITDLKFGNYREHEDLAAMCATIDAEIINYQTYSLERGVELVGCLAVDRNRKPYVSWFSITSINPEHQFIAVTSGARSNIDTDQEIEMSFTYHYYQGDPELSDCKLSSNAENEETLEGIACAELTKLAAEMLAKVN